MSYTLKFNSKSTAAALKQALTLAEGLGGKLDGKTIVVTVDTASVPFQRLLAVAGPLAHTELSVDGREVELPERAPAVFSCVRRADCDGCCTLFDWRWGPLLRETRIVQDEREPWDFPVGFFHEPGVIIRKSSTSVDLDRDALIDMYHRDHDDVGILCPRYKTDTLDRLAKLPEVIHIDWSSAEAAEKKTDDEWDAEEKALADAERHELVKEIADEVEARLRRLLKL